MSTVNDNSAVASRVAQSELCIARFKCVASTGLKFAGTADALRTRVCRERGESLNLLEDAQMKKRGRLAMFAAGVAIVALFVTAKPARAESELGYLYFGYCVPPCVVFCECTLLDPVIIK